MHPSPKLLLVRVLMVTVWVDVLSLSWRRPAGSSLGWRREGRGVYLPKIGPLMGLPQSSPHFFFISAS